MTSLVNNYDESPEFTSIDEVMDFFAENSVNSDKTLIAVGKQLDKEFLSWVKFTYSSQPRSEEQWEAAEIEFLEENYKDFQGIEKAFDLQWPHKIDAEDLV